MKTATYKNQILNLAVVYVVANLSRSQAYSKFDIKDSTSLEACFSSNCEILPLTQQFSICKGVLNFFSVFLKMWTAAGFPLTRGTGGYGSQGGTNCGHGVSRLKSQLSFTRQDSLSQISEVSESVIDGVTSENGHHNATHSFATTSFGMDSWDNTNSIVFSAPPGKRAKNMDGDIFNCLNVLESQVL